MAHNNSLRAELLKDAELLEGGRDPAVRVQGLAIDDRIAQLRRDPRFAASFPADPPTLRPTDLTKMSENINKIADGSIRVE